MVITEEGTTAQRRYSLTGNTPQAPAYWARVVEHLKRVSVYPPDATHERAFIRLRLFRKARIAKGLSCMPSALFAYALPNGRHLFLAEFGDDSEGILFDIVNEVPFPGLTFTADDLAFLMDHPSGTVRTFALTNLLPIVA